jgi:hypothetical protein
MIDQRLRHRGQHGFGNGHGSRDEQQVLLHLKFRAVRASVAVLPAKR